MLSKKSTLSALLFVAAITSQSAFADPFKLGVEQDSYMQSPQGYPSYPAYPAPHMVPQPQQPKQAPPPKQHKLNASASQNQSRPLNAGVSASQAPPMRAQAQMAPPGVLPQQFLGQWNVMGSRAKVTCRPEYQDGIENIFSATNNQTWNISGNPGNYAMGSSTGLQSVQVSQANQTMAWIRYQHPMKNTMIQEAIVMQLSPDGRSFNGIERISVIKPGEQGPRAQVTYNLMGSR